jgi:deoxycytidylate deaminase
MDVDSLELRISKDEKYAKLLKECYTYSQKSAHPHTHNAALLFDGKKIVLEGVNQFPPGVKHEDYRLEEGNRNIYINHAETDVIYRAAREGIKTEGLTMVMAWLPCIPCANSIISAGIEQLICHKQMIERTKEKWQEELKEAVKIMKEAGIEIIAYDGKVGAKAYMHRKEWDA